MTGTENEVPYFISHFPGIYDKPKIFSPGSNKSGLGTPKPFKSELLDIPLDEKYATSSKEDESDPTPITVGISPGFSALPGVGPSLPIADTTITPAAVSS